jgi:predicted nuclease of predicted toxin-antitoxin system
MNIIDSTFWLECFADTEAGKISKNHKMPMADSIIYAMNLKYNCILWTQDKHFMELKCVKYFEKQK